MVLAKRKNRGSNSSTGTSNRCTTATTAEDDDEHNDEEENEDNHDDNDDDDGIHLSNATSLDVVKEEMHNTGDDIEEEEEAEGNYDDDNDCDCDEKEPDGNGANNQLTQQHQLERQQSLEFGRYSNQAGVNNHCLEERVGTLSS